MAEFITQNTPRKASNEATPSQHTEGNHQPVTNTLNVELSSFYTYRVLTNDELRAISAVIAYVAYSQEISEETVRSVLTTTFGIDDVKNMPRENYDDAIHFLVDLRLGEVVN